MQLRVTDAITRPSRAVNEDGWIGVENQIWVLDGASGLTSTPVTDGATDAAWLVERARTIIEGRNESGLVETLAEIVNDIESRLPSASRTRAHELPSASLVAIALVGDELHVLTLGDCRLLLRPPGGEAQVIDDASVLDRLDGTAIELLSTTQRQSGAELDVAREEIGDLLRRNRDLLNRPDGYLALAPGLDVTDVAQHRFPVMEGTRGLLVSDGFYRLVDTFRHLDADGLVDSVGIVGADALLERLRAMEAEDPEGHRFPRLKRSDDATVVAFEVVPSP